MVFSLILKSPEDEVDELSEALATQGAKPLHKPTTIDDIYDQKRMEQLKNLKRTAYPPPDPETLAEIRLKRFL